LKSIIEIWTSREPITKFGDPDVHSRSLGTWMTPTPSSWAGHEFYSLKTIS
jgi:hypothetical protein